MSQGKIDVNKLPRKVTKPTISCFPRLTPWLWIGKNRLYSSLYSLLSEGAQIILCILYQVDASQMQFGPPGGMRPNWGRGSQQIQKKTSVQVK